MIWSKFSPSQSYIDEEQSSVDQKYAIQNAWDRMMQENTWEEEKKRYNDSLDAYSKNKKLEDDLLAEQLRLRSMTPEEIKADQEATVKGIMDQIMSEDPEMKNLNNFHLKRMLEE